jgi:ketosteroid isomerase-like protein
MEPIQIVKQAYASFQRGDIPAILESCSEDVKWFLPGDPAIVPVAGMRDGVAGVATFFSTLSETQDAEQFEPREFITQGDTVIALGEYRWRIKKNGKSFGSQFAHVFTVRDGKVTVFREFYDTAAARDCYV